MSRCRICGKYVDVYEWPAEEQLHFRPDLCYSCYQAEQQSEADEAEDAENFDPNTEYGMSEVKPDPEDDDAPDLGPESDNIDELENQPDEPPIESDEERSLKNIQQMLFG